jgi:hypothetical protein
MAIEWVLIWLGPFKRKSGHRHTQREKTVISKAMREASAETVVQIPCYLELQSCKKNSFLLS